MVRETRYLIVRNLPENCTEEKVIDHFQRYGKIQSVKLQAAKDNDSGGNTATVAFNDIKSAAKAHHAKNNLGEVTLRTDYWEGSTGTPVIATTPVTTPTAVRPNYTNAPASTSKTVASFTAWKKGSEEETSSNQEKVVAAVASGASTLTTSSDKVSTPFDHPSRSRPRERLNKKKFDKLGKNGSFGRHGTSTRSLEAFRSQSEVLGLVASTVNSATTPSISASGSNGSNGGASVLNPIIVNDPKDINSNKDIKEAGKDVVSKSAAASPGSRNSGVKKSQSNSRSVSRSRSKSQGSKSSSSRSDSSGTSRSTSPHKSSTTRPLSMVGASKLGSSEAKETKKDENDIDRRPLGICVKGLPLRSTDSSLRDGLYHEYKKHGKVTSVQICLEGDTRCAIVSFRKPEDASKALEASQGKIFFGTKIRVTSHEGVEVDEVNDGNENDSLDEYHPKSTRTLFVGNLEKETIKDDLIEKFKQFGEIIDVDVKRQGATTAFAFVQYVDITSVVAALRAMEGEHIGINKIKLGFGKSMPTFCVWVDNLPSDMTSRSLKTAMARYGDITYCFVDKIRNRGLIYYTNYEDAQHCVSDIKMRPHLMKKKLQIDFASRECQNNFLDRMEETGQMRTNERPDESRSHTKFRQRSFENVTEEGSPSSFVYSRSSSGYGSRRRRQYDSNYTEESHQTSRRSRRAAEDFTPQSTLYYSGKGTSDDYVAELREYEYSKRERRDRDLSPRHSSADRRIDGQSCRGSRDHSLDRYEERQKERSGELFNSREISPGSEHNSFHSENRYRSSREDKYLNRDRYEDGKTEDKDFDHHSRPSRTTSPFLQNHTSLHSHDSDLRRLGSQSPPTPLQEDAPRFYLEDYKQRVEDDFDSYSSRRRDSEELKSKSWINSSKLGAEMIKTVESRKRSHEQSGLSDLTKLDSKLVRKHEKSSMLAENKLKKIHRQLEANRRDPSSPGSSGSHGDSENGSVSEGDLHHLHQEKQHILKELKECEAEVVDASEPESPHSGARMKSVAVKDNSKLFGRILEDKRAEELSFRRQEKLRRLNSKSWNHISDDMSSTREDQHLLFEKEDSPREHSDSDLELKIHAKKRRTEFPSDSSDDEHLESCSEQNVRIPNSLLDRRAMCDSKTNSFKFMENSKLTDVSSSCDNGHLYKGGLSDKDSSVIQSYRTSSSISNPYLTSEWNMPLPAHESSPPGFSSTYSEENTQDSVMSGSLSDKSFKSPPGSPLGKYCSDSDSYSKYVVPDPEDSFSDDSLSDNQLAPIAKDLEERLRCIDEILNGTTSRSSDLTISSSFSNDRLRKSGLDGGSFLSEKRQEPSVIMQQVLNKKSILDQDIIRLKCNNKMDQTAELELGIKPLLPISPWPHPVTTSSSMLQPTITTSVANSLSTAPISTSVLTASIVSAPVTSSINISPKTAAVDSLLSSRLSEPANNCGLPAEKLPVSTNLTLDVPLSSVYSSTSTSKSVFSLVQCSSVDSIVDTNLLICPPEGKCTSTSLPPSLPSHTPLLSVSLSSSSPSLHVKSTMQQIVPPSLPVTPCPSSSSSIMSSVTKSPVGSTVAAPFTQGPDKLQLMPTVGQEAPHIYSSSFTPENSRTSTNSHLPGNQSSRVPTHKPRDDQHNKQELIVHIIKTEDESKNNVTVSKTEDVTPDIESPVSVKSETSSNSSVPLSSIDNKNNLALEDKAVPIVQTSSSENNNIVIVKSPISSGELKTGVSNLFSENTLEKSDSFDVIETQTANTNVKKSDVLDWSSKKPEVSPPVSSLPVYGVITKDNPDKKDLPSPSDNINKGKTMSSLSLNNDNASKVNSNVPSTSSLSSTKQSSERSDKKSKTSHSYSKNSAKSEALFAPDVKVEQPKEKTESKHPNKDSHKNSNKSSTSSDKKVSKSSSKEALDNKVVSGSSKDHDKKSEPVHKSSGHESSKTDKNKVKDKKESEKTKAKEKEETKKKEDKKPGIDKTETKSGATKEDKKVDKKVDEKKEKSEKEKSKENDKHPLKKTKTESTDKKDKKLKTKETVKEKVVEKKAFSSLSCVTKSSTPEVKSKDGPKSDFKLKTDASKSEEKAKFESKHKQDSKSTNKSEKSESHLVPKKVTTDSSKSKKENEKESNKHLSLNVKKKEEKLKQKLKEDKSKDETKEKQKEEKEKAEKEENERQKEKEKKEIKEKEEKEKLRREKEEKERQKEERERKEKEEKLKKEKEEREKQKEQERLEKERKEREEKEKQKEREEREKLREKEERERREREREERERKEKEERERKEREKEEKERKEREKEERERERKEKEKEEKERKDREEKERKEKEERERKEKEKEEKERREKEKEEKERKEKERKEKEKKEKKEKERKAKEEKLRKEKEEKAKKEREDKAKREREEKSKKDEKGKKEKKDKKEDKDKKDDKDDDDKSDKKPPPKKPKRNELAVLLDSNDRFQMTFTSMYDRVKTQRNREPEQHKPEPAPKSSFDKFKKNLKKKGKKAKSSLYSWGSNSDLTDDSDLSESESSIKADSVKETKPKKTGLVKKRLHVSSTSSSSCDEDEDALLRASKANGKKSEKIFSSDSDEDNFPIPKSSNKSKSKPAPKRRKTREDSTDSMTSREEFVKPHAKNVNEDSLDDLDLSDDDDTPKVSVKKKTKAMKRPDKSTDGDKHDSSFESVSKKSGKVEQEASVEPVTKKSHKTDKDETPAKKLKTDSKVIKSDIDRKSSAKSEDKNKLKDSSSDKKERKESEAEIKLESKKESENKKDIDGKKSADSKKEDVKKEVEVKHEHEKSKGKDGKDKFFGDLSLKHSDEKKKKKDKEESVVKKKKKKKLDPKAEEESVNSLINKVYDSSKFDKEKKQKKKKKPILIDSDSDLATSETSEVSKPTTVEEKVLTKPDTEVLKIKEKNQESVKENVKEKNLESFKEKNQDSVKEKNQDSVKEKSQDSVKEKSQDSVKEKSQESVKEKNQESVKEKNQETVKEKEVMKEKHSKETNKPSNDSVKKSESKKKDVNVEKESDKSSSLDVHKRDKKTKDKGDHSERKSISSIEDLSTKPPKKKKKKKEHEKDSEKEKSKPSKIKKDDNKLDGNKKSSETENNSNADTNASQQSQVVDEFVSFWGHPKPILIPKRLKDTPKADDDKKHKEKDDCKTDDKMETSLALKEETTIKDEKVVNDKPEEQQDTDKTVKVEVETNEDIVVPISEAETTVTTELAQSTSSEIAAISGSAHQSDAVSEDVAGVKDETTIGSSVEIHEDDEDPSLVIDELSESVSDEKKKLTKKEKKLLKQQQEEKERNDHMDEVIAFVANAGSGDEEDTGDKESPSSLQIDSASNDRELDLLDVINLKYETKFSNEKEHKSMIVSDMFFQDDKKKAPETAPFSAFRKDKKETSVKIDGDQEVPQKPSSLAKNDDTSLEEGATVASTESPEKEKEDHKLTEEEIKEKEAEELRKKQEEEERKAEEERKKVEEEKARQEKEQQAIREASDEAARAVESILEFENTLGLDIEDDLPPLNIESESIETPTEIPVSPSKDKSETELFFNNAIPEKLTANLDDQLLQESKLLIKGDHTDHKMDPLSFFAQPQHAVIPGFTSPRRNSVVQDRPSEPSVALQSPQRQIPQSPQIQSPQIQSPQMPSPQRHMQSPQRQLTSPQRIQSPQRPLQSPLRPLHSPQIGLQSPPFFNKDAKMERSILSPNRDVLVMHEMEPTSVQTTQRRTSGVPVTAPETSIDPLRRKSQEFPSEQAFHSPRRNTISVPEEAATTHLEHRFQHHQGASVIYSKKSPHGQSSLPPPVSISLDNAPHDKNFQTPIRNISIPPHQDCNLLSPKKMSPSVHFKDIPADPTIFQNTSTNKTHLTDSLFPSPKALFSEFSHHQKHSTQEAMFHGNKSQIHDILKATIPSPDQHIFFTAKGTMPDKTLVAKLPENNFSTRTLQEQLFQQKVNQLSHERIQDSVFPPKGHLSQDTVFSPKGHLSQDTVFSPKGHLSQDTLFSPKGHLPQDTLFSPKGHLSQDTVFSPKGHISQDPVFSPKGGHLDASYNYSEPVVDFLLNSPPRHSDLINYTPNSEVQKQLVVKPVEAHDLFNNKDTFHPVDSRLNERVEQPPRRMEGFPPSFYQEPTPAGNMPKFAETVNLPPTSFDDDKKNPRKRNRNSKKNTKEDRAAALAEQQAIEQSVQANLESIHKSLSASQAKKAETNPSEKKKSPIDAYDFEAGQEMMPSTMSAMEHTNFSEDLRQTRSRIERGKRNNRGGYGTRRGKNGRGGMMSVMESPESLQRQESFSLHQQPGSQQTPFNVQQSQDQMITTPQTKPLGYLSYQFPSQQQQQQSSFQRQNSQPTNPSFYPSPQSSSDNTSMSQPEWQMKPVPQQHSQNTLLQQPVQSVLPQQHGQNALPQQHGQNALPQQHGQNALPQQHGQTLQSLPQQHISHQQPALLHQQQPQIPQQLKLPVKVDERSPETNKLDLDSSFGESQLVINLDDQPSSIEGKENQNSLSSDGESPATPKTQRSTRARKQTNYKAIASGTITVQPPTRLSRSGGSPRGRSAGTQSPKNNMSPRASSSENVQSSPVVKLEKLEVTRTTRRRKAKEETADENSSFEDWKAKKGEDKKVVPKDNVYEFDDTEQDQNKEPNLRSRTRKKRASENQDPTQIGVDYLAASPPASNSSLLSDPKGIYESLANDTKPTEEVSKQTPLSNVDAVIDAVSKGLFGSIEEDSNLDIPLSAPLEIASTPSPLPAAPTTRQTRRSTEAKKEAEQKEVKFTIEPAKADVRDAGKKGPTVPPIRIKVAHVVEKKEEKHYTIERANKTVNSSTEHHEKPPLAFTVKLSDTGTATIKPAGSGNNGGHFNSNTLLAGKNSVSEGIKYGENKVQDGIKYGESNLKRDNNLGLFSGLPQNEQQQPITEHDVVKSVPSQSTPWKPVDSVAMDSPITRPSGSLHPKVAAKVQASQESMNNASSISALLPNNVAQTSQQQPILPVTSAALPSQAKPSVSPVHSGLMWNSIQGNLNQPSSNPHLPMHLQNSSLMKDPSLLLQRPPSAHDLMNKRPPSAHSQTSIRPERPVVKGAKMGGMDEMVSKINVDGSQKHSEAPFGFAGPVPPAHIGQRPYMMEQQGIPSSHHSLHFPNSAFKSSLEMRNTKSPSIPPQTSLKLGSEIGARTPPVTAAPGAMLYAGIVSSQPISLSPTSASPEGQVIERHPNPNSLRETGCQSPLSLRMHSDPRFLKDDLENSVQSSVHGEQTSTREMMFLMEQQRLRQHLLLVQENNRTANPDQAHPADARNMRLAHDQARNTPVGPNNARKSSLSSQPVGLNQPLNLADSDSRVDPSRTPKSTPPAPQSPFSLPYLDRKVEPGRMQVGVTSAFMQPSSSGACEAIAHMYPEIPLGLATQFNLVGRLYGPGHQPQSHLLRENVMQGHFPTFAPGPRFQVLEPYDKKGESGHQDQTRGLLGSPSPNPMLSRQADLLLMKQRMPHELQTNSPVGFLQRYPVMWQGALALKNDNSYVQMHFIAGNRRLPNQALPQPMQSGVLPPLRISQRMRLEQAQLEGVSKRMQCEEDYCILIAVACGRDQSDISVQTRALNDGFITYLLNKQAAGIVNVPLPGSEQAGFVVHIFPPCDFVDNSVAEQGSITLMEQLREVPHAVIIIATT